VRKFVIDPIAVGILPLSLLLLRDRDVSATSPPKELGTDP